MFLEPGVLPSEGIENGDKRIRKGSRTCRSNVGRFYTRNAVIRVVRKSHGAGLSCRHVLALYGRVIDDAMIENI